MQSLRNKIILILFNPAHNPLCQVWVKIRPEVEGLVKTNGSIHSFREGGRR